MRGDFHSWPLQLRDASLFTDLYQLTMAAAFFREKLQERASFSLWCKPEPPRFPLPAQNVAVTPPSTRRPSTDPP